MRPEQELVEISEQILDYEFEMLIACRDRLGPYNAANYASRTTHNAFLEAFVVHARTLTAFYYHPHRIKPDDILVGDFFDNPAQWAEIEPEILRENYEPMHKYLAHLSDIRLKRQKDWPYKEITEALIETTQRFIQQVPPNRLHSKFRARRYTIRQAISVQDQR